MHDVIVDTTYIAWNSRLALHPWFPSHSSAPSDWCCYHCKRAPPADVALLWPFFDFEIYRDMPIKISQTYFSLACFIDFWVKNHWLTCRHSGVRAFPQQLSPFSWRWKQSNSVCSSLRRQLDSVSWALIDIAQVFWQFIVIACWQHNLPDHCAPRVTAIFKAKPKSILYYFTIHTQTNSLIEI